MITTARPRTSLTRRAATLLVALTLATAGLAGCSSDGADTQCGLDQCTVTFDRGVDANASILGVDAKLVGVNGDQVTVEVAGEQLTLTIGQQGTEVAGLNVSLQGVTDSQVVIRIARN